MLVNVPWVLFHLDKSVASVGALDEREGDYFIEFGSSHDSTLEGRVGHLSAYP